MGYSDLPARDRYMDGSLGYNEAEAVVERYFQSIDRPLARYGFQGIPTERAMATTWPSVVRHTPDYVTFNRFVEVKSCWDETFKFKIEDLEALEHWNRLMPVYIALYQARHKRLVIADLYAIKWACKQEDTEIITLDAGTKGEKQAYLVKIDHLIGRQRVKDPFTAAKQHPITPNYVGY